MMKKLIALLLSLTLLLCGCAATSSVKEPDALSELGEGKRTECVAVVTVTINPEFELYLDSNLCVSKVRCLNEDAVTAMETVQESPIGKDYRNAMLSILDGAAQAGFLTEGAQVKIETTLHTYMDEQTLQFFAEEMAAPAEQFSTNQSLNLAVESVTPTVDEKAAEAFMKYYQEQAANQPGGNQHGGNQSDTLSGSYTGDITDENGNRIGTAEYLYDANGNLLNKTLNFDNGTSSYSTYEYDTNGTMIKEESVYSDGSSGVYTYFPNGSIETSVWIASDGYTVTETYYESGILKSSISDYDGNHSEYHYAEDGTLIEEVIETRPWNMGEPNSVQEVQVYNDHGEGTCTQYFDENGYLYKDISIYADGATYENTYYENSEGIVKSSIMDDATGHYEWYYYEDGTANAYYYTDIEGNYQEITYHPNGNFATQIDRYISGGYFEVVYYENGKQKSNISYDAGIYREYYFYEDGTPQQYIEESSGKYYEVQYHTNGQMSVQIHREGSTNFERHYDEAGNVTYSNEPGWQP